MKLKNLIKIILIFSINLYALNLPKSFSADFTQNIYQNKRKVTYKGKIIFKNNQIYWKYTYPTTKEIWVKDKVYIYEPDLMQVTISKKPKLNLIKLLKNAKQIDKNLYVTKNENKKIYFIYNNTLKKLYYNDDVGNRVEIYFSKPDKNLSIPPLHFPDDVDIIYQD